jgi:hypothetical protein
MAKRYSKARKQRVSRQIQKKVDEITSKHVIREEDLLDEVVFTTKSGMKLKCFPVDESIIAAKDIELRKEFEAEGIDLEPPKIVVESAPGASNPEIELNNEEACYVKGDEEETDRRLKLYNEWYDNVLDFSFELNVRQQEALLVYGLGSEDYFGFKQEGGIELPDDFEDTYKSKIEALGYEWKDDYFWQMSVYIDKFVLRGNVNDTLMAIAHIQSTSQIGIITKEQFGEMMATAINRFRGVMAERIDKNTDTSK